MSNLIIKLIFLHKVDKTKANLVCVRMHTHAQLCMQERKTERHTGKDRKTEKGLGGAGEREPCLLQELVLLYYVSSRA